VAKYVALDLGKRRVGVAVGNNLIGVAVPSESFLVSGDLMLEIDKLVSHLMDYDPSVIVIGDPVSLNGSSGIASSWVHEIGNEIARVGKIEIVYVDERLTTRSATRELAQTGQRGKKLRSRVDSASAAVILSSYFDTINGHDS
ncbi:unnamed protein product, partial [Acidithrix sp. C25]